MLRFKRAQKSITYVFSTGLHIPIPPAGTNIFNELPYLDRNIIPCRLRLGCRKLRSCRSVELIDARHIRTWEQMPVNIRGHLNAAMTHLVPDVRQWRAGPVSHLLRALETFRAQGIEFVSFSEQLDTSTPAGKMVFTVLGAVAELERGLIVERVKAGLRNAKAKGKALGRPRKVLDVKRIAALRAQGIGWKRIAVELGVGVGTIRRTSRSDVPLLGGSKTPEKVF